MSNNIKDTLHELIKYMSKSEKRYFKVVSSKHTIGEGNKYTTLFDFIESQQTYDEQEIFKHFEGEAFLNKFSITKKRLYDHVISALDQYHCAQSVDAQIYKLLNGAEILYQKSLYNHSLKQLVSAEKLASKHHKYNLLLEINLKLKRVYESQGNLEPKELKDLLESDIDYQQKSLTYAKFWNLKSRLFALLSSKGVSRSEKDLVQFKEIIDELLKSSEKSDLYLDSQYLYHHIYSAYYFATNSFDQCYQHLNENLVLLETSPRAIEEHPNRYLSVLTNAVYVAFRLDKNTDVKLARQKLKDLASQPNLKNIEDLQIKLFSSIYSIDLTVLMMQGELEEAAKLIPVIESGLLIYEDKITDHRRAFLNFKIACVHFARNEFHLALKWINEILNNSNLDKQEDLVSFSHLMNLLIHCEMKNDSIIQYVLRNTQRYLKSRDRLYEFEQQFLKFINKMSKKTNEIEREELWSELYHELSHYQDDNLKRVAFEYFDFITWAEAKAERKSFGQLTQQKLMVS